MKKNSSPKKKKKRDENDSFNNSESNILFHNKQGKLYNSHYYSEIIVKCIINKIISLSFSKIDSKKINNQIIFFIFNNMRNSINNLIELYNINHEIDICSDINIKNNLSFNKDNKKTERQINNKEKLNNTFNELNNDSIIDKKTNKIQFSVNISDNNYWDNIPQPKTHAIDRTCNKKNILKNELKNKENTKNINLNKNKLDSQKLNKKFSKKKLLYNLYHSKKNTNEENIKLKKSSLIYDFPSETIPEEQFIKQIETAEIKELRKNIIDEINKKNIQKEDLNKKKKKINENEIKIINNYKKFKKERNISSMKHINPNSLIEEFTPILSEHKEIKSGSSLSNLKHEKMVMQLKAGKCIEYNKLKEKDNRINIIKKNLLKNLIKEHKNEEFSSRIRPSGSNFELIHPEVGVVIKEELKFKSGGTNFLKKYHKFSIHDFNKTLINTNEISKNNNLIKNQSNYFDNSHSNNFSLEKDKPLNIDENNKKKLRKTFSKKIHLKKKNMSKSKSEISLSDNQNMSVFRQAMTARQNDEEKNFKNNYYLNYFINNNNNINNSKNNFENYFDFSNNISSNKIDNSKIISPIPTNRIKKIRNSFLKTMTKGDKNNSLINKNKIYKMIDNFNKNIIESEYKNKFNENKNKNEVKLPKLPSKLVNRNYFYKTKEFFYRTRKRKNNDNKSYQKINSKILK